MHRSYDVRFDIEAERDLEGIADYLAARASLARAIEFFGAIRHQAETLSIFPERGAVPKELDRLGVRQYRQTLLKQYRIFYEVTADAVVILLIADGRRDMDALLSTRLLTRDPSG